MKISEGKVNNSKWKIYNGNCLEILSNMIEENDLVDFSPDFIAFAKEAGFVHLDTIIEGNINFIESDDNKIN